DGKKGKDAAEKKAAVVEMLGGDYVSYHPRRPDGPPSDPRWLDAAVRAGHLGLVNALGRPGHKAAEAFVQSEFDAARAAKNYDKLREVVWVMVRHRHPDAVDAVLLAFDKTAGKANQSIFWLAQLVPDLPKATIPGWRRSCRS